MGSLNSAHHLYLYIATVVDVAGASSCCRRTGHPEKLMNRIFRILWSHALNTWVVASELATSRGKSGGGVDKRRRTCAIMLDRNQVEGSPPRAVGHCSWACAWRCCRCIPRHRR
ncbi:ESPR domain-containing protein [Lysobacter antibioticus]|uniref:ESPR domain-containing protein n=1 Tax=Lysobacter antibioticus TaxID=84531 RepID=UPI003CE52320